MAFPDDELDTREAILLDTNPTFGRLVWPLLGLMVITGVCWLLIGFIDGPAIAPGDLQGVRQLLLFAWLGAYSLARRSSGTKLVGGAVRTN